MRRRISCTILLLALLLAGAGAMLLNKDVQIYPSSRTSVGFGLVLVNEAGRVYVLAVSEQSAADLAGFEPGDYIISADGQPVRTVEQLDERLMNGLTVPALTVCRGDQELSLMLMKR